MRHCPGGLVTITRSRVNVTLGEWHHIEAETEGRTSKLTIDDSEPVVSSTTGSYRYVDVLAPLFIGGVPHDRK